MDPILGQIILWAGTWAPQGWFFCQGQTLPISQYQALFSLIGTVYGGDGVSNFKLPNLQGIVVLGTGTSPISGTNYTLGEIGGTEQVTLLQTQMPIHTHMASANNSVSGTLAASLNVNNGQAVNSTPAAGNSIAAPGTGGGRSPFSPVNGYNTAAPNTALATGSVVVSGNGLTVNSNITVQQAGGNQPHNNLQPFLVLNYMIAWNGIYPSRP